MLCSFLGGKNELYFCLHSMQVIEETRFAEICREQSVNYFLQCDMCSIFVYVHVQSFVPCGGIS